MMNIIIGKIKNYHPFVSDFAKASSDRSSEVASLPAAALCVGGSRNIRTSPFAPFESSIEANGNKLNFRINFKNIFILVSALFFSSLWAGDISLRITSMDNQPLQEAGVGQPFLLHVVIKNINNTGQRPTVTVSDGVLIKQAGFQMNMINNKTSITYHYELRIDTAGTYTLGPAIIVENGTSLESPPLTITVSAEQKSPQPSSAHQKHQALLRLSCDKTAVIVGQKVHCMLSFYTTDARTTLHTIKEPEKSDHYKAKSNTGPMTGKEIINGIDYNYVRWEWDIIPNKAGACIIPAYAADFSNQVPHRFFSMLLVQGDTKRIYSNTVQLNVDPLPSGHMPQFIGTIAGMQATIESSHAKVGQGLVYSLSIIGDGDFDCLNELPLKNMPTDIKWYESTHSCEPAKNYAGHSCYKRDYILQALNLGAYQIPAQELYYFDVQTKTYKTIKTVPIDLTINADTAKKNDTHYQQNESAEIDEIRPLHDIGYWYAPTRIIPWPLFWSIIFILFLLWLATLLIKTKAVWLAMFVPIFQQKSFYARTKKLIKKAHDRNRHDELYPILINFLAEYTQLPAHALIPENIDQFLLTKFSFQAIHDWQSFFSTVVAYKFSHKKDYDGAQLTDQALYWIDVFATLKQEHS